MNDTVKSFYNSKNWQITREAYKTSVGGLCEICRDKGIIKPGVIIHHKIHITPENINDPNITLSWNNLQCLCRECHGLQHRAAKRYKVDPLGGVISFE